MTKLRYLAIAGEGRKDPRLTALRASLASGTKMIRQLDSERLELWSNGETTRAGSTDAVLVGEIASAPGYPPRTGLDSSDWASICSSHGQSAIDRSWGNYVLFLGDGPDLRILRAPFGDLGCLYARRGDLLVVASDLPLLRRALDRPLPLNRSALIRQLGFSDWRSEATCLEDIFELRGGTALDFAQGKVRYRELWSPWRWTDRSRQISDREDCARRVRDAILLCVKQRSRAWPRLLLLLSGGLDSSVVGASLADAGADFACLNLIGDDAASDERYYADVTARHLHAPLATARFEPELFAPTVSGAAAMPYPVHRGFTQVQDTLAEQHARAIGASAVFDGGGGDNVFFALRTISLIADCLLSGGFDARFREVAAALGDATQVARWQLAILAARRAWLRSPAPRQPAIAPFLAPEVRRGLKRDDGHPWMCPPPGSMPGRASHVALMIPAQNLVEAVNAQAPFRAISPLVSQPVVEACLRVPSWFWLESGRDRAATRRAFASRLPAEIIDRRSKGVPNGVVATLYQLHRHTIRDLLLGGRLAELELVDRHALSQALCTEGPVVDLNFIRLMELLDVETWLRAQDC